MDLFINSGICRREFTFYDSRVIRKVCDGKLKLTIPNYIEDQDLEQYINFILPIKILPLQSEYKLNCDLMLNNISLIKINYNTYEISSEVEKQEDCMYALLRSLHNCEDDICIPSAMRDKVDVIKRIRFIDENLYFDYGEFLSNIYLIKITLTPNESIPIYLTMADTSYLDEYYIFHKNLQNEYFVSQLLKTKIDITHIDIYDENGSEYISLSKLCNRH